MKETVLLVLRLAAFARAAMTIELASSVPSPQPVGAVIGLLPKAKVVFPGPPVYRYDVSANGGPFHMLRDFSQAGAVPA